MSRPVCPRCERPERACICQWVRPTDNRTPLLILQHPGEVHQAKNSARLLTLSLTHCVCREGERWSETGLAEAIGRGRQPVLLYPDTEDSSAPRFEPSPNTEPEELLLIVLDATWRKSRKMLYLNPLLQSLPRLALTDTPEPRYRIRRAQRPGQLSTLEASCYALAHLEAGRVDYSPLLDAFDGFNEQQLAFRPGHH